MPIPTDEPDFNEIDLTRCQLREGIESSRQIVRQSHLLIELSESGGAPLADSGDMQAAK